MKKIKLIAPILGLTTAATLGSTLVSCGDPEVKEPVFTINQAWMNTTTEVELKMTWETDIIHFIDGTFQFSNEQGTIKTSAVLISEDMEKPARIRVTFNESITQDITDGVLTFHYNNETTKQDDVVGTVENIKINHIDYVLDQWNGEKNCLLLTNAAFEANKKYNVKVDLSKIEDDLKNISPVGVACIGIKYTEGGQKVQPYYDDQKLGKEQFAIQGNEVESYGVIPNIVFYDLVWDQNKSFYLEITLTEGTKTWLSFQTSLSGE